MKPTVSSIWGALSLLLAFVGPEVVQGLTTPGAGLARRATVCNGFAELCSRGYGTLAYVGTHNSYAVGVNGLANNQDHDITQQLNDGVRMLQVQAHVENNVIRLCHTDCRILDGGTLDTYLGTVKTWLDANPNEVLSLLIVNSDSASPSSYATSFVKNGLDAISYTPPSPALPAASWPTLGELIDSNQRLITFLSKGANVAEVPYLLDEFSNMWETAFNVVDPLKFDCTVDRRGGDTATQMFVINHFLDKLVLGQAVPDIDKLNQTNAATGFGSLGEHVSTCQTLHGRPPNFLLVDFYEYGGGSVFQVAAGINGVTYNPTRPIATPISTAVGTNASSSSRPGGSSRLASPLNSLHMTALMTVLVSSVIVAPLLLF